MNEVLDLEDLNQRSGNLKLLQVLGLEDLTLNTFCRIINAISQKSRIDVKPYSV